MDSTLPHLTDSRERLLDARLPWAEAAHFNSLTTDFKNVAEGTT